MMVKSLTLVAALLLVSGQVTAAKLYKVVDENGKVTFSQFPPKDKNPDATVESVHVRGGDAMESVTRKGSSEYCGSLRLPHAYTGSSDSASERYASRVNEELDEWRDDLRRLEARAHERSQDKLHSNDDYYNNSQKARRNKEYQQRLDQDASRMREYRCAISWAEKQQQQTVETEQSGVTESQRLKRVHANLEAQMQQKCGREPLLDPTDASNARDRRQWKACSKQLRKDLRAVQSEMYRR